MNRSDVKVLNEIYKVIKLDSEFIREDRYGATHCRDHKIEIYNDVDYVWIHELLHAYLLEMGHVFDGPIHNENNIEAFTKIITNMMADGHLVFNKPKMNGEMAPSYEYDLADTEIEQLREF